MRRGVHRIGALTRGSARPARARRRHHEPRRAGDGRRQRAACLRAARRRSGAPLRSARGWRHGHLAAWRCSGCRRTGRRSVGPRATIGRQPEALSAAPFCGSSPTRAACRPATRFPEMEEMYRALFAATADHLTARCSRCSRTRPCGIMGTWARAVRRTARVVVVVGETRFSASGRRDPSCPSAPSDRPVRSARWAPSSPSVPSGRPGSALSPALRPVPAVGVCRIGPRDGGDGGRLPATVRFADGVLQRPLLSRPVGSDMRCQGGGAVLGADDELGGDDDVRLRRFAVGE